MTAYMTQKEYAEHRGVSPQAISKLKKRGKLAGCFKNISGKKLIDQGKADVVLHENLDQYYNKPGSRPNGKESIQRRKEPTQEEISSVVSEAGLNGLTLLEAQTKKETYTAALKKLEYETKQKELIPAYEVEKVLANMVLSARGKILSIKGLLAPLLKEFIEDGENFGIVMNAVENTIRDILTEISDAKIQ